MISDEAPVEQECNIDDDKLIDAIFNKEIASSEILVDSSGKRLPSLVAPLAVTLNPPSAEVVDREREIILKVSKLQPENTDELEAAISELDKLIELEPNYASLFNNRAQLKRMISTNQSVESALVDIKSAIAIATGQLSTVNIMLPNSTGKAEIEKAQLLIHKLHNILQKSYLQRVAIRKHQLQQQDKREREEIEEKIRGDLHMAGKYGHVMAQKMAVQMNPYAKLCASMVKEMLKPHQ